MIKLNVDACSRVVRWRELVSRKFAPSPHSRIQTSVGKLSVEEKRTLSYFC